ncbi:hypothetical protein [Flavobacterium sp.]|uniref:hypothetical protein n=1 Tax=Flavobacterium sp. TaxID=239 RepID=UPI00286D89B7|nr:hypothetical protein [Flavobacterium sp.]
MKLHLHFSHGFHFGHSIPKTGFLSNDKLKTTKPTVNNKLVLNKLQPSHWFDGIWDDLNFKM